MPADETTPLTTRETATLWSLDFDEPTVTFDCGWRRNGVTCDQKASHLFQCRTCTDGDMFDVFSLEPIGA
jgi:hypothetical protein